MKLLMKSGVGLLCALIIVVLAGCGKGTPDEIALGMSFQEVENILGKPSSIRQGISFLDSSRVARVVRGSNLPVVHFSPTDKRINWVYDISRVDTGAIFVKDADTGRMEPLYYSYTLNFCVLFSPERGKVVYYGYYPFSVRPLR
ncbi:MAG: hypothetical protein OEM41_06480 [Ignavibacteria bacterium]|nr:hypothetical protein [Ignavibacteria bacterium]